MHAPRGHQRVIAPLGVARWLLSWPAMINSFEDITVELDGVRGGFNAGRCFDDTAPWAVAGAATGAAGGIGTAALGAAAGGAAGYATSVNCGDGQRSPMTMAREGLQSSMKSLPDSYTPTGGVSP